MTRTRSAPSPSAFVVGAPRCGTTALCNFLGQHPDIFVPYVKEPHYFGQDLTTRRGFPDLETYLKLFRDGEDKLCLEGSTWYLYSRCAAKELHGFNPDAKIIIMVRNPTELIRSWHAHAVVVGVQDQTSLEDALEREPERREGKAIPVDSAREKLLYTDIPRFTEQITRYYETFGREQIHIIIYDDFKKDNLAVVADTFHFLGVETDFVPIFDKINASGKIKSRIFRNLLEHQPERVRKLVRAVTPRKLRTSVKHNLRQLNTTYPSQEAANREVDRYLKAHLSGEVQSLSELLGRNLLHWNH